MDGRVGRPDRELPAHVLVVDDELSIRKPLSQALQLSGFSVDSAASGEEALAKLDAEPYDVMVLDLRMPGVQGEEVMQFAHVHWPDLSTIILTGHARLDSAINAVRAEAVDYLTRPVSLHVVTAAVNRALQLRGERRRREQLVQTVYEAHGSLYGPQPPAQQAAPAPAFPTDDLHLNPLTLDRKRRSLTIVEGNGTRSVEVSESEMRMLSILMSHPGQVFSCRQLVQQAFGESLDETAAQNVVRPFVSRLRAKLRACGTPPRPPRFPSIRTVRGRGYFVQVARESSAVG